MNRIRTVLKLLLPVLCLLAGSCGYQLGGTKPPKLEFAQTVKVDLFANNFRTIADEMNERGCKVLFSGRREGLQQRVLDAMDYMMNLTKDNDKGIVNFCLNYGSHAELTDATRAIAAEVKAGALQPEEIDEKTIEKHLYRDLPPVDLMIRTSGEERISNFLLWQCAYAEFYFTDTLFPDFTKECFDKALAEYARRDRRMGGNTKK